MQKSFVDRNTCYGECRHGLVSITAVPDDLSDVAFFGYGKSLYVLKVVSVKAEGVVAWEQVFCLELAGTVYIDVSDRRAFLCNAVCCFICRIRGDVQVHNCVVTRPS